MKPILFDPTATDFTNNGLGALVDSPRCIVREERNGPYELEMDYPVDGQHFSEIEHSAIIYAIPADGKGAQPFRIYEISKPFDGLCTIYAEHLSYQLAHIPVTPFGKVTSVAAALQGLKNNAAESCPYTFWTDKASAGTFEVTEPKSIRELLGGTQGSILDAFGGGEYEWDKYTVKLHQRRGQDKGVVIKYGRNLTDLKQEEAIDTTITGIYPFWADAESGTLVTLPEKVIHSANANNFPYNRTVVVDASSEFQDEPTVAQLRSFANNYITQTGVGVPKVSIDISFAPLWQTEEYKDIANLERVNLCDTVTVVFEKLGVTATAKVVKTEYDVLNERYEKIELGDARTTLAKAVSSDISSGIDSIKGQIVPKNVIESMVDAQTALITGAMGGYIKIVYNAAGQPQELLFMDTDDIQTAVNVIRINKNGIGFSNDGYDPTKFVSAWTIDGKFNADFIATGHLLANYIQGGTLSLGGVDNGNGVLEIYDANGSKTGEITKDGFNFANLMYPDAQSGFPWARYYASLSYKPLDKGTYYTPYGYMHDANLDSYDSYYTKNTILQLTINNGYNNSLYPGIAFIPSINGGALYGYRRYFVSRTYNIKDDLTNGTKEFTDTSTPYGNVMFLFENHRGSQASTAKRTQFYGVLEERKVSLGVDFYNPSDGASESGIRMSLGHTRYSKSGSDRVKTVFEINDSRVTNYFKRTSSAYNMYRDTFLYMSEDYFVWMGKYIATISSSSRRYKHSIRPIESEALDPHKLLALPIVQFEWNDDHPLQYDDMRGQTTPGIIAEDVAEIYPSAVIHDTEGQVESWDERRLIPGMLALIQEQDKKIKELEARLARLEKLLT